MLTSGPLFWFKMSAPSRRRRLRGNLYNTILLDKGRGGDGIFAFGKQPPNLKVRIKYVGLIDGLDYLS